MKALRQKKKKKLRYCERIANMLGGNVYIYIKKFQQATEKYELS